ncbi:MAG: RNA pseudouridine synthase [Rhodospirillaceae bacterium]|nr:RNA pseudouridine synthase [Rhodospirillaceae bacterium]|tara:strand:- start:196 stop:1197 length:1002 start_codon:yes stop_codon:yes gene_type:complete
MVTVEPNKLEIVADQNKLSPDESTRLDRWLVIQITASSQFSKLSRTRIKNLIQDGFVAEDGQTIRDPSTSVKHGMRYTIKIPEPEPAKPKPQSIHLNIIFEDDYLIVLDKPAGMVVHPAPGSSQGTLVNALLAHCGASLSGIGGIRRPGIVHRLDKDTTGLILIAKTDEAHQNLVHQFAARSISRKYKALIWGNPTHSRNRIDAPIGRSRRNRKKMAVTSSNGKPAATRYEVIEHFGEKASLIKCQLETGRTHQIRVHMCHIGHPIIGDPLYGSGDRRKNIDSSILAQISSFGRQALHAYSISFKHPISADFCDFFSPLPSELDKIISLFSNG